MERLGKEKEVAEQLEKRMREEQKMGGDQSSLNTSVRRKTLKSSKGKKKKKGTRIIMSQSKKSLKGADMQKDGILNMKTASNFFKPGGRAYSANVYGNPKLRRYEQAINKLKKMTGSESKKLREIKTIYAKEIESKTQLEQLLRQ